MNDLMTKSFETYRNLKKHAEPDISENQDIESGHDISQTDENKLSQFFKQVDPIKSEMEEINNILIDLQNLNAESKTTHSAKVLRGLRDRMDADVTLSTRKVKSVKSKLESLDRLNQINVETAIERTEASVTSGLRIKLRELMNDFQALRETILSDYKEFLKRRFYNSTGEIANEEVVEKMLSGGLKMDDALETKTEIVLETKERHEAVIDIQKSLEKLHQVFLDIAVLVETQGENINDIAVLVETQGENINDIAHNVEIAGSFVSGGTNNLFYGRQYRNKMRCVFFTWLVGVIILVAGFLYLLSPWS